MNVITPSHVVFETLDGRAVLLNLNSGSYFELNPTATRIWALIQEHQDKDAILAAMLEEFDQDPTILERDLEDLLRNLDERGLITTDGE